MPIVQFAPNKNLTGGAAFWKKNQSGGVTLSVFKQIANNADKRNNFDFSTGINVKFSNDEIGGIISAIRTSTKFNFYHQFEKDGNKTVSNGSFAYYNIANKVEGKPNLEGFGLSVTKDGVTVKVAYTLGGAEVLAEFLKFVLKDEFIAIIDEDAQKDEAFAKSKDNSQPAAKPSASKSAAPAKKAVKPAPAPESEPAQEPEEPALADESDGW